MSSFLNAVFTMELAVPNTTLNTTPINSVPAVNTLAATTVFYNPAFQCPTSLTTVPLPSTPCWIVYVKNLDPTNILSVVFTPTGAGPTSLQLPPGAVFLHFSPNEAAGTGIAGVAVQADSATISAEIFLGA